MVIEKILKNFGLNEKEIELYLIIVKEQRITPLELSRKSNIKRPTVYVVVDKLIKRGLVEEDIVSKSKYYIALSSNQFNIIINEEKRKLLRKEDDVKMLINELSNIPKNKNKNNINTRVISGNKEVLRFLREKSFVWVKSCIDINEKAWWGFQTSQLSNRDDFQKWIKFFWKKVAIKGIDLRFLVNNSEFENRIRGNERRRKIKIFDKINFKTTQIISGNYVINISIKNGELYLLEIEDKNLAENLRDMFKFLYYLK